MTMAVAIASALHFMEPVLRVMDLSFLAHGLPEIPAFPPRPGMGRPPDAVRTVRHGDAARGKAGVRRMDACAGVGRRPEPRRRWRNRRDLDACSFHESPAGPVPWPTVAQRGTGHAWWRATPLLPLNRT